MQKGLNLTQSSAFKKYKSRVIGFLTVDLGILLKASGISHMVFLSWWIIVVYGGSV